MFVAVPGGRPLVLIQDDGIYIAQEKDGKRTWSKKIEYTTTPEVGKSPVEFWNDGKNHPGNPITQLGDAPPPAKRL